MTRLALDTSALIYLVEGSPGVRNQLAQRIGAALASPRGAVLASRLVRLECRVKPLRDGNTALLDKYDALFGSEEFMLADVTPAVLDRATELRARHGFKTPDAIHLASAIEVGADDFLTGDANLAKCPDLNVEVYAP